MRLCSFRRLFIISPQDSELSDAEVDRSGIGPRFNLSEIKTGIQEDAGYKVMAFPREYVSYGVVKLNKFAGYNSVSV